MVTTQTEHSGPNLVTLGHTMNFSWAKRPNLVLFGASKRLDLPKSVSDAYPGNIGHLDHYVVFGTQSGAVQDIQMGKNCSVGAKQTPF